MSSKCLFSIVAAFIVSISLVSNASAGLVAGSSGTVNIIGNDSSKSDGSYKIQVVYSVYDGTSSTDPLGLTTNLQIAFQLTHLGGDGELPALNIGRFFVFAPSGSGNTVAFYQSISTIGTGTAPSTVDIDPPPAVENCGKFIFEDSLGSPTFAAGNTSKTLVLTATKGSLNKSVILEIDTTNTSPSISSDVTVNIVPEPASIALLGIASLFIRRRRKI